MDQNPFVLARNPFRPIFIWLVLGLIGPVGLVIGVVELPSPAWHYYVLRTRGVPTDAVVTAVVFREHGQPNGLARTLAIRFPTATGSVDEQLGVVDTGLQNATMGDRVAIVYDPRDPSRVRPSSALLASGFWSALGCLLSGGVIVVLGGVRIVAAVRRRFSRPAPVPG